MRPIGHYLRGPWDSIDAPVKRILMDIGEGMVWVAATFSLGLIIGAETTKVVVIDAAYRTPGLFGRSVAAGADTWSTGSYPRRWPSSASQRCSAAS